MHFTLLEVIIILSDEIIGALRPSNRAVQSSGDPPELKHYGKRSLASDSITEQLEKFSAANNKNSEQLNGGRIWVVTVTYMAVLLVLLECVGDCQWSLEAFKGEYLLHVTCPMTLE